MSVKVTKVKANGQAGVGVRYIGRFWSGHAESCYHNPFHIGKGTREECILKFIEYWYAPEQKWLREGALNTFEDDAVLGCWCHPLLCHGDIIAGYVNWKRESQLCL